MFGSDPEQVERRLLRWSAELADQADRFRMVREQMGRIEVTASSPDGAVRVTVDSTGSPTDLVLTDRVRGMAPAEIATQVMACIRRAQGCLAERVQESVKAAFGREPDIVEHVLAGYRVCFPSQFPSPGPGSPGSGSPEPGSPEPEAIEPEDAAGGPFSVPPPRHGRGSPEEGRADSGDQSVAIRLDTPGPVPGPDLAD
jgi:hypothetical protein